MSFFLESNKLLIFLQQHNEKFLFFTTRACEDITVRTLQGYNLFGNVGSLYKKNFTVISPKISELKSEKYFLILKESNSIILYVYICSEHFTHPLKFVPFYHKRVKKPILCSQQRVYDISGFVLPTFTQFVIEISLFINSSKLTKDGVHLIWTYLSINAERAVHKLFNFQKLSFFPYFKIGQRIFPRPH